jgi:hypothetical protein
MKLACDEVREAIERLRDKCSDLIIEHDGLAIYDGFIILDEMESLLASLEMMLSDIGGI